MAAAIVAAVAALGATLPLTESFESITGLGVIGCLNGREIVLANGKVKEARNSRVKRTPARRSR